MKGTQKEQLGDEALIRTFYRQLVRVVLPVNNQSNIN